MRCFAQTKKEGSIIYALFKLNCFISPNFASTHENINTVKLLFTLLLTISFTNVFTQNLLSSDINKLSVAKSDSSLWLIARMQLDHRIFGYAKPDTNSQKLILLSIFTNDVKDNPYKCPFGSYYETSGMENIKLKFLEKKKWFIKAEIIENDSAKTPVYFLKKWVEFEK